MRPRSIATFALGTAVGVTACAALTTGVLDGGAGAVGGTVGGLVGGLVGGTPASAAELSAFDGCEQLRRWYVRAALEQVGPYGLGGATVGPFLARERSAGSAPDAASGDALATASEPVGSSDTGTNVAEADVDEADTAKTDGRVVVRVVGSRLVVTDVTGPRPRVVSRTTLPGSALTRPELVLGGDRVVVVGTEPGKPFAVTPGPGPMTGPMTDPGSSAGSGSAPSVGSMEPAPSAPSAPSVGSEPVAPVDEPPGTGRIMAPWTTNPVSRVVSVDVGDPTAPRVVQDRSVRGSVVSTRSYADGAVRVVVDTARPDLDFVAPGRGRTVADAIAENRRIVRTAGLGAWLPAVTSSTPSGGTERTTPACGDVRHPARSSGLGTVTVLSLGSDDDLDTTAVTTSGDVVYSSADRLYVATTGAGSTDVHAFSLEGGRTSYVASGSVPGTVKDRWSFSEHDGHLRVATATGGGWGGGDNAVVVLTERDGRLVRTGRIDGIGKGEDIKSVRWLGDLAVVVTFRQTDPLYTVDLSDPAHPEVVGELTMPGYSAYLHPLGGDLLLGLGQHATASGSTLGGQAATFDLSDRADVRRVDTTSFGPRTGLGVETDPHGFTYLPEQRTFLTQVWSWESASTRFVAVHVAGDGTLSTVGSWTGSPGAEGRALPLGDGRVALVDDGVRVVQVVKGA